MGYPVICFLIVDPHHRQAMLPNQCLLCDHGVDHQGIKAAMMAPTDGPLFKRQVRVHCDVLVQYLRHHSGKKFVLSVQAGNGSILLGPSLTTLPGNQYSCPLHKPYGDTIGTTLYYFPHDPPEKLCGQVELLPPETTDAISSKGLPAISFASNNPPDSFVDKFNISWARSF